MPLKPDRLERSLKLAEGSREVWEKELSSRGIEADNYRKNPRWRSLNAACKRIQNRIDSARELQERGNSAEAEAN